MNVFNVFYVQRYILMPFILSPTFSALSFGFRCHTREDRKDVRCMFYMEKNERSNMLCSSSSCEKCSRVVKPCSRVLRRRSWVSERRLQCRILHMKHCIMWMIRSCPLHGRQVIRPVHDDQENPSEKIHHIMTAKRHAIHIPRFRLLSLKGSFSNLWKQNHFPVVF